MCLRHVHVAPVLAPCVVLNLYVQMSQGHQKGVKRRMGNALICKSRDFSPDYLRSRRHSRINSKSLEVPRSETAQACLVSCVMYVPACLLLVFSVPHERAIDLCHDFPSRMPPPLQMDRLVTKPGTLPPPFS